MIAFEVKLNGKRVCIAGAKDLCVLGVNVSAVGKLGPRTVRERSDESNGTVFYSVSGLTARPNPENDVHVRWKSTEMLKVGDVVQVRVLEAEKADRPKSRKKADRKLHDRRRNEKKPRRD